MLDERPQDERQIFMAFIIRSQRLPLKAYYRNKFRCIWWCKPARPVGCLQSTAAGHLFLCAPGWLVEFVEDKINIGGAPIGGEASEKREET